MKMPPSVLWLCVLLLLPGRSDLSGEPQAEDLFGLDRLVEIGIRMDPEEWERMQPRVDLGKHPWVALLGMGRVMDDIRKGRNFRSSPEVRPGLAGYMGIHHTYGRGEVTIGGSTLQDVGIRYKGNGTFLEGLKQDRYSYKIDFREYADLEFRGLTKLNLHSNVIDETMLREPLSLELFRLLGVPCSRLGFARLRLESPGEADRSGIFSLVEQIDKRFLGNRFGSSDGLLLKPSTFGVFRYFGEDWEPYEIALVPKTDPTPEGRKRVIEFARLLHRGTDEEFSARVEDFVDIDSFLHFLAGHVLLSHLDSFLSGIQNYYVYLDPGTGKFRFIPWDMDLSFGNFMLEGTHRTRLNLSVDNPGGKRNRLIGRILAIPSHRETYHRILDRSLEDHFNEEVLGPLARTALATCASREDPSTEARYRTIIDWVKRRAFLVREQMEGRIEGDILFEDGWN